VITYDTTEAPQAQQDETPVTPAARPKCELPGCENVSLWRGTCSVVHHREMQERRRAEFFWGPLDRENEAETEARVYGHPREEVDRVDALNCEAPAAHRIGDRLVCTTHRLEVLHAYWETDSNLALFEVDETAGFRCGETFPAVTR